MQPDYYVCMLYGVNRNFLITKGLCASILPYYDRVVLLTIGTAGSPTVTPGNVG